MKIKTINLVGKQLNYAVAVSEGFWPFTDGISWIIDCKGTYRKLPEYSTDWAVAGPIIEREGISLKSLEITDAKARWVAKQKPSLRNVKPAGVYGQTPLIAAMRCYVSSKLGPEVEIPGELL